nr:protein kinase [Deltaproteobacteria bacterium]
MPDETDTTHEIDATEVPTALEVPQRRVRREPLRTATVALDVTRYEVIDQLGRGGMGDVSLARDGVFGREIAIKRMLAEQPSDHAIERFLREARIQGGLDHPAIPPVHELAIDTDGKPYFVMKRVAGTTLGAVLQRTAGGDAATIEKYPRGRLLRSFAEACLAVELAHTRGVIHRDLKPSNVMLGELGEVYVLDWGVAKVIGDTDPVLSEIGSSGDATHAGAVIGTRGYMPPEQAEGALDVDARADVFALGCMLFEILTIKKALVARNRSPRAVAPDRDIPPELDDLCVEATEPDRAKRLASARELGERVQRYLDGDRDLEQRRTLARAHLEGARSAADRDPDAAMREAGRALALDPSL